jgi:hypothetical protein
MSKRRTFTEEAVYRGMRRRDRARSRNALALLAFVLAVFVAASYMLSQDTLVTNGPPRAALPTP